MEQRLSIVDTDNSTGSSMVSSTDDSISAHLVPHDQFREVESAGDQALTLAVRRLERVYLGINHHVRYIKLYKWELNGALAEHDIDDARRYRVLLGNHERSIHTLIDDLEAMGDHLRRTFSLRNVLTNL